jgi:hypothetical protein
MAGMRRGTDPDEKKSTWHGVAKFLGLVVMVTVFFLLAQSMVRHHFFTGGAMNNHHRPTGP